MPRLWQQLSINYNVGETMETSNKLESDHLQVITFHQYV